MPVGLWLLDPQQVEMHPGSYAACREETLFDVYGTKNDTPGLGMSLHNFAFRDMIFANLY
jgi:hypothetical protein